MKRGSDEACPCGSGRPLPRCCGKWFLNFDAPTALQLMRSRYVANVQRNAEYLLATWHPRTRPSDLDLDSGPKWLGLTIRRTESGDAGDTTGIVEFVARYRAEGKAHRLHEVSRFERLEGKWFYVDGDAQA